MIRFVSQSAAAFVLLGAGVAFAHMAHDHGAANNPKCTDTSLACASQATPAFASDGTLWVAWTANGAVSVAHSSDLGRTFSKAVAVNPQPLDADWGPDSRPSIVVDKDGRIFVAFARFRDHDYNGEVLTTRSIDGGRSFTTPVPITANTESQRFQGLALDTDGALFAAWLDKRERATTAPGKKYIGAGLAFAWSTDKGASFATAAIAHGNTCECCRLAVAFAAPHRPVVAFRNIFGGTVRDHAVMTFRDPQTPGAVYRVSVDDWETDVCPHQGPSLAVAADGTYHVAWFTNGRARQGLFYASSADGGRTFSTPMPIGDPARNPSRPYLLTEKGAVWLAWKEFDGEQTTVVVMTSRDSGHTWDNPQIVAQTRDASDHPLLAMNARTVFVSWQTRAEGYRLLPVSAP